MTDEPRPHEIHRAALEEALALEPAPSGAADEALQAQINVLKAQVTALIEATVWQLQ